MLQDLAAQRASAGDAPVVRPPTPQIPRPAPLAPGGAPPANLPSTPAPVRPPIAPLPPARPVAPLPLRAPAPMPPRPTGVSVSPQAPGISPIVQPKSPPPAPREVPVAPMPQIPRPPAPPPAPTPPKSVISVPTVPPAPPLRPKAPSSSAGEGYTAELRTMSADIGNIKVGQAPTGIKQTSGSAPAVVQPAVSPVTSTLPPPTSPAKTPIIVVPSTGSSGGGFFRKMFYGIVITLVIVGIGYALFSFIGGNGTPQETATPSPSTSGSPAPTLAGTRSLSSYFAPAGPSITLQWDDTARTDLGNTIITSNPASRQALRIGITVPWPDTSALGLLDAMISGAPGALAQSFGTDWVVLSYGQQEQFDANGVLIANSAVSPRLVLISEVTNATAVKQLMTTWESASLASDADLFLGYDFSKAIVFGFSDGVYRDFPVRYWNFPYADRSIDYAVVTASNNKSYLILSGSRESAFFAIDQLMQ